MLCIVTESFNFMPEYISSNTFKMIQNTDQHQKWLAVVTFSALALLLVIHVLGVFKAARLEERIFNQRVAMAMKEARDEIGIRLKTCNQMNDYLCGHHCTHTVALSKTAELDSILHSKLEIHNINLPYTFSVMDAELAARARQGSSCFQQSLNGLLAHNGVKIQLEFPDQSKFVRAQLSSMFLLSVVFILLVGTSFVVTFRMFRRERAMMQRTIDFVNNLVHEFQTPLANIRLATGLMRKMPVCSAGGKGNDYLLIIQKERQKLQNHVENILQLATIEQKQLKVEVVDLAELTQAVFDQYQPSVEALNGRIHLEVSGDFFKVKGNASQFEMVWNNLIDNAIKYSVSAPEVTLRLSQKDSKVYFSVADKGVGISRPHQALIFDQYYRIGSGDTHPVKGFGLGLYMVRKVVEMFQGKIEVESSHGKGSTFIIEFPVC